MSKVVGWIRGTVQKNEHVYRASMGDRDRKMHRSKWKKRPEAKEVKKTASWGKTDDV